MFVLQALQEGAHMKRYFCAKGEFLCKVEYVSWHLKYVPMKAEKAK